MENVARPLAFSAAEPSSPAPSEKVTEPSGEPTPAVTFAVKVTICPNEEGSSDEVIVVEVGRSPPASAPIASATAAARSGRVVASLPPQPAERQTTNTRKEK